uniref:Reticulocyte-binding protein 2 a n=1 Tax=Anthurium amnicola TaxID=1678845 RepID=A0A1D1YK66_9ARAE
MEPAAGRVGSLPMPSSQAQRREWRAVSESCVRSNGNEVPEHVKLGQSDERTIYEVQEGTGPLGVDLCSITIDGGGDELQQRLHSISRQREELQQVEIELRARVFAKTEIVEMQKNFDTQISEHVNAVSKLKEQLHKREQHIHQLEMKMEEKERELRAVKIDKEAAWAKEDRLREQNKELATFRVVRDNLEAERAQHLKQIHELEECLQAKENQYLELEKQHRVAHETTLLKDEQLKEAHAWMAHAQEMDAFHSTTNQALQAELQEHIEQFNQCLIGLHQQLVQVDRHYRQTIQQLQLDLAEAREQNITLNDDSQMACTSSMDPSSYVQNKGNHIANVNVGSKTNGSLDFVVNGDNAASFMSTPAVSAKSVHVPGAPVVSSSILGLSAFLPPGQVITPHPFVMHPQGTQSVAPVSSHVPQTQIGYFQPVPTISSYQHWKNQQAASEIHQIPNQSQQSSQVGENLLKSDAQYSYEISAEQRAVNPDYLESFKSQGQGSETIANGSDGKVQVIDGKGPRETSREDSHYHYALGMDIRETSSKPEINGGALIAAVNQLHAQVATSEEKSQADIALTVAGHLVNSIGVPECNANVVTVNESSVSAMQTASSLTSRKVPEPNLLDERALLACLVRVIPAVSSGGIRISSTLPNRLGKMLAPLHWHDYRKQYGKLDDFVACHPELFVIEGDFIHLREGAQEMISTTTAFAKVAAAAAASKPYSSMLPSVAVTPVAQPHRVRKDSSAEMKTGKGILCPETAGLVDPGISPSDFPQILSIHNQQQNGVSFNVVHGISDLKIRKSEVPPAQNCSPFGTQSEHVSLHVMAEKEFDLDKTLSSSSQSKGSSTGRHGVGGKQQRSQGLRHRGSC